MDGNGSLSTVVERDDLSDEAMFERTAEESPSERRVMRTMIVDRNALIRAGLRAELGNVEGVTVVSEASGGPLALQVCRKLDIDLAIVGMPGDGVDVVGFVTALKKLSGLVKILCGCDQPQAREAGDLVRAGVDGIVHRDAAAEDFVQAVRTIMRGNSYLPRSLTQRLVRAEPAAATDEVGLTGREMEVLRYIADGYSNKDIARRMELSVRTVECHRLNLRRKSGMLRPKDLVGFAQKLGLRDGVSAAGPTPELLEFAITA